MTGVRSTKATIRRPPSEADKPETIVPRPLVGSRLERDLRSVTGRKDLWAQWACPDRPDGQRSHASFGLADTRSKTRNSVGSTRGLLVLHGFANLA
jgi:hypothetical protein